MTDAGRAMDDAALDDLVRRLRGFGWRETDTGKVIVCRLTDEAAKAFTALRSERDQWKAKLDELSKGISTITAVVAAKDEEISALIENIATNGERTRLMAEIAAKDAEIARLLQKHGFVADYGLTQAMEHLDSRAKSAEREAEANRRDAEALRSLLSQIITDLPTKRDWLDPALESAARAAIAQEGKGGQG